MDIAIVSETRNFEHQFISLTDEQYKHLYSPTVGPYYGLDQCSHCQWNLGERRVLCALGDRGFNNHEMLKHMIVNKTRVPIEYLNVLSRLAFCNYSCMNCYLNPRQNSALKAELQRHEKALSDYQRRSSAPDTQTTILLANSHIFATIYLWEGKEILFRETEACSLSVS